MQKSDKTLVLAIALTAYASFVQTKHFYNFGGSGSWLAWVNEK